MKKMNIICDGIRAEKEYAELMRVYENQSIGTREPLYVTGLSQGAREVFAASLILDQHSKTKRPALILVPEEREFGKFASILNSLGIQTDLFPFRELNFYDITASHDYEHERLSVLSVLSEPVCETPRAILATPDAALEYTMPKEVLCQNSFSLCFGQSISIEKLIEKLLAAGYVREDMVNGVGQFSRRGYIVDIFSPLGKNPYRIEFFDEEIDQISIFDVMTQRRIENVHEMKITPAREVLLDSDMRKALAEQIAVLRRQASKPEIAEIFLREIEALQSGVDVNFLDKYISLIYPQKICLMDYFLSDKQPMIFATEKNAIDERVHAYEWQTDESVTALLEKEQLPAKYADFGKRLSDLETALARGRAIICDAFASGMAGKTPEGIFSFSCRYVASMGQNYELLTEDLAAYIKSKYRILLFADTEISAKNLQEMLAQAKVPSVIIKTPEFALESMQAGVPYILCGYNFYGFELPHTHFVCFSLFDHAAAPGCIIQKRNRNRKKKDVKTQILSYADLSVGDYVVHRVHGIGRYRGIKNIVDIYGNARDYIEIEYAGDDMLFIPCDQLDAISKYIGAKAEDGLLKLSKMGGGEWKKTTARVKAAAREMAKELIKLYAERMRREGFAFPKDDEFMREFEAGFEYEETDGQRTSIDEIKADMERSAPMDRLLCGDVGFGKTEVAMRAAFKAVLAGKQVAVLVPTTILAMQHYQTMLSRMRSFGVRIGVMLRFQTPHQQEELLRRVRRGDVDIIIGTHRIISADVSFRDLGLVIIDEEQRFGVAQKEKLKQISKNVDVLTLSATPIPRTLNMAMSGIRDMSILDEAPEDRVPVQTYVLEYDDIIITEAIKKELRRGGQVFFLHNNVETIYSTAKRLSQTVPEARIGVAHGRLDKNELSEIWQQMVAGEIDILVSTTIIETGVDVPNANTLIIEFADRMGLSQLHQLRGRIGRSSRRAYAYFTFSRGKVLSEIATKRLQAIRDYTEFGAGFKIAMRDLEIRGAGNVLGSEQHGHMESVGYDLYIKILNEAILEEKGESVTPPTECIMDLMCSAYIPKSYIGSESQRIEFYKKIAAIATEEDFDDVCDEISDRYGEIPHSTLNLIRIAYLRELASRLNIGAIEQKGKSVLTLRPQNFDFGLWSAINEKHRNTMKISISSKPFVTFRLRSGENVLDTLEDILKEVQNVQINFTK